MTETKTPERAQPEAITAVPVRHPGRWVAIVVLAIVAAMFVHMLVTNDAFQWSFMLDNMFRPPVIEGVKTSLLLTVLSMVIGVALGIVIAMMRLSPNPILSGAAWLYTWFFRAVPRIVLLILFGNRASCTRAMGSGCRSTASSATWSGSTSTPACSASTPGPS